MSVLIYSINEVLTHRSPGNWVWDLKGDDRKLVATDEDGGRGVVLWAPYRGRISITSGDADLIQQAPDLLREARNRILELEKYEYAGRIPVHRRIFFGFLSLVALLVPTILFTTPGFMEASASDEYSFIGRLCVLIGTFSLFLGLFGLIGLIRSIFRSHYN